MQGRSVWFLSGLFVTTLATLLFELLNTRLLSVVTWYHLSFFAVSIAMFGMSAGAIRVYLGGSVFEGAGAARALARYASWLAIIIPLAHVVTICVPIQVEASATAIAALTLTTVAIAAPFYVSGIVVAIALTRVPGPSGLIYAVDLVGASLGSLVVLPLLAFFDISSAVLVCAALAAFAAALFHRFAEDPRAGRLILLGVVFVAAAGVNSAFPEGLRVAYSKGRVVPRDTVVAESWSIHGRVVVKPAVDGKPWYWGAGRGAYAYDVNLLPMDIDGMAGTAMTKWDGLPDSLEWVKHDVSALPYHLRKHGDAAIIGVGGGRDVLTALWAGSRSVTGIEINGAFLEHLNGRFREYAGLADRPEVRLVHDEARSYLTRTDDRYDVLQMSLIDTWAATGAGAFTLSENGLYTLEAWDEFLGVLKPDGIFSVSRWYSGEDASETSRLLALAAAALFERGVDAPAAHMALVAVGQVATLLVSPQPLARRDLARIQRTARRFGFDVLLAPGSASSQAGTLLGAIFASRSRAELDALVAGAPFDFSPPTDQRPYFFNILKPADALSGSLPVDYRGVHAEGNLLATRTLAVLWLLSFVLVVGAILGPLLRAGLPRMERSAFAQAVAYFALIGLGYMLVQIPLIQRFSVYLGHPTYAVAVILFSMILATGVGSWLSDRIPVERERRWLVAIPLGIAFILLATVLSIQPIFDDTIQLGLLARCAIVVAVVSVAATPLGLCFPVGLRLVRRLSEDAMPWMWGVNGACGVLAGVSAVWISMWSGIHTSLYLAALLYALLVLPANLLWLRAGRG